MFIIIKKKKIPNKLNLYFTNFNINQLVSGIILYTHKKKNIINFEDETFSILKTKKPTLHNISKNLSQILLDNQKNYLLEHSIFLKNIEYQKQNLLSNVQPYFFYKSLKNKINNKFILTNLKQKLISVTLNPFLYLK